MTDVNSFAAALELAQSIKEIPTLEAVILFGSAAKAEMHKKSDIDLLLVFNSDHNPETGDEGKIIFTRAIEIERKHKLENPFSFVFLNLDEDIDADFVWEVVRDGSVLYYRPEGILSREAYLSPALLIAYTFEGISQKDRMYINRVLYGYRSKKVHKGKEYVSEREGLIPRYARKLGRATFIVDARKGAEVLRLFDKKNVLYTAARIWSTSGRAHIVDMKDLKKKRFDFLRTLFDDTGDNTWNVSNVADIGGKLGFDPDEAERIAQYLHDEGLIEIITKDRNIRSTHAGIREVKHALSEPDKSTEHFPALNIIHLGSTEVIHLKINESQTIQVSPGAELNILNDDDRRAIGEDLALLKERIEQLELPSEQESDLSAEIETIQAQMKSSKPKQTVIKESFGSIKGILESAAVATAERGALSLLSTLHFLR